MDELRVILTQKPKKIEINGIRMFIYPTPGYYIILTDDITILVTPSIYLKISPDVVSFIMGDKHFDSKERSFQTTFEYEYKYGGYSLPKNGKLYITSYNGISIDIGIEFKDDSGIISSIQTCMKCIFRKSKKCFDLRYPPELF